MKTLLLHTVTEHEVNQFVGSPAHLLILIGRNGAGKGSLARQILSQVLKVDEDKLDSYQFFRQVSDENSSITIDQVRQMQKFLSLKSTGTDGIRRGVIIEHSELLTIEAQNALLKILEEPPLDTLIVMTVESPNSLLATIYSRSQIIQIKQPAESMISNYFKSIGVSDKKIDENYRISGGQPGLLYSLLLEDNNESVTTAITEVKRLLTAKKSERLVSVNDMSSDKLRTKNLIYALERIAFASLEQAAQSGNDEKVRSWSNILENTIKANNDIRLNGNAKLILTNLFLNI